MNAIKRNIIVKKPDGEFTVIPVLVHNTMEKVYNTDGEIKYRGVENKYTVTDFETGASIVTNKTKNCCIKEAINQHERDGAYEYYVNKKKDFINQNGIANK
jgi:hypothetical protein